MPAVTVDIQPTILHWVLKQLPDEDDDTKIRSTINGWIDGTKTPTFNQIEDISKKSCIPLGYFFLKVPPVEEIGLLEFRTVDSIQLSHPSRELLDTINLMEERQDFMVDYRNQQGMEPLSIVGRASKEIDSSVIADMMRKDLAMAEDWSCRTRSARESFNELRKALENVGVLVMMNGIVNSNTRRVLDIEEFRAFALVNNYAPLIFINAADSDGARLFSLLHEAVHIWIGQNDLYNDRKGISGKPLEVLCNAVAAELLVPEDLFRQEWGEEDECPTRKRITKLATAFHCGETVIARRALDFGLIDKDLYLEIANGAIKMFYQKKEEKGGGGNYYGTVKSRLDGPFVQAVCESVANGDISFTNTSRKTFDQAARELGGTL